MSAKEGRKLPTMKDVARQVGVSVQTVSAVVNNKPDITSETRARVLAAIEQLNYRPYMVARSLRTRQTHCPGGFKHYQRCYCGYGQRCRSARPLIWLQPDPL